MHKSVSEYLYSYLYIYIAMVFLGQHACALSVELP